MKIAYVYGFTAYPPKGGNHARFAEGGWAMRQAADVLDLRIGGNRLAERVAGS